MNRPGLVGPRSPTERARTEVRSRPMTRSTSSERSIELSRHRRSAPWPQICDFSLTSRVCARSIDAWVKGDLSLKDGRHDPSWAPEPLAPARAALFLGSKTWPNARLLSIRLCLDSTQTVRAISLTEIKDLGQRMVCGPARHVRTADHLDMMSRLEVFASHRLYVVEARHGATSLYGLRLGARALHRATATSGWERCDVSRAT